MTSITDPEINAFLAVGTRRRSPVRPETSPQFRPGELQPRGTPPDLTPVWHTSLHNPDWAAYAGLCGAAGIKVDCREQLDQAMTRLFAVDGPAMLHVSQDPELL